MDRWEVLTVDGRTREEILREMKERAVTYTPEWEFTENNPDAGSVIALIFARQMERNIRNADSALSRCHMELIHMLGLTPRPASPARSVAVMELDSDTVDGTTVSAGTRLLADGEGGRKLVFETCSDLYVSNIRLNDILGISGRLGKAVSYMEDGALKGPAALFDYSGDPVGENGVLICHPTMLDIPGGCVYLSAEGNIPTPQLMELFSDADRFGFYCSCKDHFARIGVQDQKDGRLRLSLDQCAEKMDSDGKEYGMIYIKSFKPAEKPIVLKKLALSGEWQEEKPELLAGRDGELVGEAVRPFGEKIELYDEFYVGSSRTFSRRGALVSMEFELSWEERIYSLESEAEPPDLKVIRKKKYRAPESRIYRTAAAAVSAEYFNGVGWKRIPFKEDWGGLFGGSVSGPVKLTFRCPADWKETAAAGYEGLILRFKIIRADNCYLMPCIHKIPVLSGCRISCSYEGIWEEPERMTVCSGAERREVRPGDGVPVFTPFPYEGDSVFFGFEGSFTEGPICLFLKLREMGNRKAEKIIYEYSAQNGMKELQMIDHTEGLAASGTLTFLPPSDMAKLAVMGRERYWIRMKSENDGDTGDRGSLPVLEKILMNAAEAENVESGLEEKFFLDEAYAGEEIALGNRMILDAEVYVNEKSVLLDREMERLLLEAPERVRAEYDYLGGISAFFVRWEEVENFRGSGPEDRHYRLDRRKKTLQFGNGVRGKIPGEKRGTAYTVRVRFCDGEAGNVAAGAVSMLERAKMFVGSVCNITPASGGKDMESPEQLCARGEAVLSSLGRLVSQTDYIREVLSYSPGIAQAAMIIGRDISGKRREGLVSLVLLMRDYRDGPDSFDRLKGPLKGYLLERCDGCINEANLCITKPLMIRIEVEIWACLRPGEQPLAVREKLLEALRLFLEPETGRAESGRESGRESRRENAWESIPKNRREIGNLPRKSQITAMLHSVRFSGHIVHVAASAVSGSGLRRYEVDLDELGEQPFGVGINGEHRIHLMFSEGG